ncbi:RDD family protein [Actinacidiphila sp. bgisy167]|uniref:RDD family protein n=1 Tax=Actinacidiphila sp. bgisy167 TaxID=3413797 RepID=UPI003D763BE8
MSSNQPPGYGYPQGGSGGQNPYGEQPYGQQPYPQGQNPYDQQPFPQQQSPYAYPQQGPGYGQMPTDPALAGMPPLAGSGQRFVARLIDGAIFLVLAFVLSMAFGASFTDPDDLGKVVVVSLIVGVASFLYEALMLKSSGQTIGKKVMKIRVARLADGSVPGNAAWARAGTYAGISVAGNVIPCVGFLLPLLNVLWHLWDKPYRQCWHDKAAKTVVVKV